MEVDTKLSEQEPKSETEAPGPRAAAAPARRKRGRAADVGLEDAQEDERSVKRRRKQPGAVLVETGGIKTVSTGTTLVNFRVMMFVSAHIPWQPGPCMSARRGACTAAVLGDGHVLVLGGNYGPDSHDTTEVVSVSESSKLSVAHGPRMRTRRRECAAIKLSAERVIVIGGHDGTDYLDSTEVLDLATNEFLPGPCLGTKRAAAAVALLGTGHLIVVGGSNEFGSLDTTEVLDLNGSPHSFVPGPRMSMQRAGPSIAVLDKDQLLVIGGHDDSKTHSTTEILYLFNMARNPPGMAFIPGPMAGAPRSHFAVVTLNSGNIHMIGGHNGYDYLDTTEVLNLATMEVTTGPRMRAKRCRCSAAMIGEGRILVAGGHDGSADLLSTEALNLRMYTFAPAPWMRMC